jgi:hypothetical protein
MSQCIMTLSRSVFFRILAYAPEELQRQAKDDARRAIPALCFTEDDIRQKFAQEELWEILSDVEQKAAVGALLDADEYGYAGTAADEAIAEAVGRYLHEVLIKRVDEQYEWEDGPDPHNWPDF